MPVDLTPDPRLHRFPEDLPTRNMTPVPRPSFTPGRIKLHPLIVVREIALITWLVLGSVLMLFAVIAGASVLDQLSRPEPTYTYDVDDPYLPSGEPT